ERDLARKPARRKGEDHEMPLGASLAVTRDYFAVAGERERFDREAGLLPDLAHERLVQGFTRFHAAARQGEKAARGRPRAPDDQDLAVADDGGADGEIRAVGIGSAIGHGARSPGV